MTLARKRHGELADELADSRAARRARTCSVDGCDKPVRCRGLCNAHYLRVWRHGDLRAHVPMKGRNDRCTVTGCDELARGRGMCNMHYQRWYQRGTTELVPRTTKKRINRWGYVIVFEPGSKGKGRPEHRLVMEDMLGRPLRAYEIVHHKNGIRNDNRPANLELWVKSHPHGQRPEDLVAWVLAEYPDLVTLQLQMAV